MAEANGPNLTIMALFSATSLSFLIYHTARFDGCRCLSPTKQNWFRCLMTWMLLISNICLSAWAIGWCYCKTQLGWVRLGPTGARPWPSALFPPQYANYDNSLGTVLAICYSLQASLNAEEALFMIHLMRSVRRPRGAVPFLQSKVFWAWPAISLVIMVVQLAIIWIRPSHDLQTQLARALLITSGLELFVLFPATIIVLRFPRFLRELKAAGAGPEVQIRLHVYHDGNKLRTFFRFCFILPVLIIGIDGSTKAAIVNNTPVVVDMLATASVGALCIAMMISITLYLPRSPPGTIQKIIMVGHAPTGSAAAIGRISILGEVARWELGLKGDFAAGTSVEVAPFASARRGGLLVDGEGIWEDQGNPEPPVVRTLESFTSPINIVTETQPQRPVEIQMRVERSIHKD